MRIKDEIKTEGYDIDVEEGGPVTNRHSDEEELQIERIGAR
jgi:hypothetical protein